MYKLCAKTHSKRVIQIDFTLPHTHSVSEVDPTNVSKPRLVFKKPPQMVRWEDPTFFDPNPHVVVRLTSSAVV